MEKFLKTWHGHTFVDEGPVCSEDFKKYARQFKAYLKKTLPDGYEIVSHRCNHYDLSGFVKDSSSGKYVYYAYSWNRFSPVDVYDAHSYKDAVLIRTAKSSMDYSGGFNHFSSIAELPANIKSLLTQAA